MLFTAMTKNGAWREIKQRAKRKMEKCGKKNK